jgi:hypothetical protein
LPFWCPAATPRQDNIDAGGTFSLIPAKASGRRN